MTTQAQLDAILHGAAFAPITDKGFLRITGPDATRWLNGMVTNNIKDLKPGEGNYNFLLNAQGRIQGDCTIYRDPVAEPPTYLLVTDSSQLETVHQTLDKFIIMDDVELEAAQYIGGNPWQASGICVIGSKSADLLPRLVSGKYEAKLESAPSAGTLTEGYVNGASINILAPTCLTVPTFELWFEDKKEVQVETSILIAEGVAEASPETLEAFRIYTGTPRYGTDIRNTDAAKDLPQETAQTHALNFNKGCYLGQEIVERIHSRGQVHRTFTRFTLTGTQPIELPAALEANGKPAGEITSVACIHDEKLGDTLYALGYARREALDTHATLTYPGGTAIPLNPRP